MTMSDRESNEKEQHHTEVGSVQSTEKDELVQKIEAETHHKVLGLNYYAESQKIPQEEIDELFPKIRRKIDMRLLSLLFITYMLQFLDKLSLNYANAYSFSPDLGLNVGQRYSWVASIFNFGYLAGAIPANYIVQRVPLAKFAACSLFVWSVLLVAHVGAKNYGGILVLRFLLGLLEAQVSPICMNMVKLFYKRSDQQFREFCFLSANGISTMVGSLLGFGLGHAHSGALKEWQLIFLVIGLMNFAWCWVFLYFGPDSPAEAKFLTEKEKAIVISVISTNSQGLQDKHYKMNQVKECLIDPAVWILVLIGLGAGIINGGVSNFASSLIKGFGFTGLDATILQLPTGAIEFVVILGFGILSLFVKNTNFIALFFGCALPLAGLIGIKLIPNSEKWALVGCTWLQYIVGLPVISCWTYLVGNVAGSTKKTMANGMWFLFYAAGNIIGANIFFAREAPKYQSAMTALIICYCVMIGLDGAYFALVYFRNKKRNQLQGGHTEEVQQQAILDGYKDQTDFENKGFRYNY